MTDALQRVNAQFRHLELTPLPRDVSPDLPAQVKLDGKDILEEHTYTEWLATAERIFESFRGQRIMVQIAGEPTQEIDQGILSLERQALALIYRTNIAKPPTRPFEQLRDAFSAVLVRYKQNTDLYPSGAALTPFDRQQIQEACLNFPVAVEALLKRNPGNKDNDPWTMGFVKFCLRSPGASQIPAQHWIRIFFELPNETDSLMSCTFDKRIGAVNPRMLEIRSEDGTEALHMRINGVWTKVHGDAKKEVVNLVNCVRDDQPDYTPTVSHVYKEMRGKRSAYNTVEVFERFGAQGDMGVLNWDAIQLGSFNPDTDALDIIDVTEDDWIYDLPVWRSVELADVHARFPGQIHWPAALPHNQRFAVAMRASREEASKEIANNHAYCELIVPEPGQPGRFRLLPFGFQPPTLPDNDVERLLNLQSTQLCNLHYPDESAVLSQRDQYAECFAITPEEFQVFQDTFSKFVQKSREGKEVFQPTGDNCGKHIQKLWDDTVGQRFYRPFKEIANAVIPGEDDRIASQVKRITKALDDDALEALSTELVDALVAGHHFEQMGDLMSLCLSTLAYSLNDGHEIADFKITPEEARQRIEELYRSQPDAADGIMLADLKTLIKTAVASQQFYKASVFEARVGNPILGSVYNFICTVEWEWLRNFLFRALCFVLGSWRTYTYEKTDGTPKTVSVWNHPLHGRAFNLPAQAFYRPGLKAAHRQNVEDLLLRV